MRSKTVLRQYLSKTIRFAENKSVGVLLNNNAASNFLGADTHRGFPISIKGFSCMNLYIQLCQPSNRWTALVII